MPQRGLDLRIPRPQELVREQVVNVLRQAIADGHLPPGRHLVERELIELTGVSRTSIREALRQLQADGLVQSMPGRGLRVTVLTEADVEDIYTVRAALEATAADLFVRHASDDQVHELLDVIGRFKTEPLEVRFDLIAETDRLIAAGAGNPILEEMLGSLHARIHALRRLSTAIPGRAAAGLKEFNTLAAAIKRRDAEAASAAARKHVLAAMEAARQAIHLYDAEVV